jgi:hypothetical protein
MNRSGENYKTDIQIMGYSISKKKKERKEIHKNG